MTVGIENPSGQGRPRLLGCAGPSAVLAFLVETVGLYAVYGQALSLLLITPVAFVLNKRWTFRHHRVPQ